MKKIHLISILITLLLVCTSFAQTIVYRGWGFKVNYGEHLKVLTETPVEDFQIYTFLDKDKALLKMYAGNHPSFPSSAPKSAKLQKTSINGLSAGCYEWQDSKVGYNKECLVDLEHNFPARLHCWYDNLTLEMKKEADSIINSVVNEKVVL